MIMTKHRPGYLGSIAPRSFLCGDQRRSGSDRRRHTRPNCFHRGRTAKQILFRDKTSITAGADSTITVKRAQYDANGTANVVIDVSKGAFRYITGDTAGSHTVKTPLSTVGVRGTVIEGFVDVNGYEMFALMEGAFEVCTSTGCQQVTAPGTFVVVYPDGRISPPAGIPTAMMNAMLLRWPSVDLVNQYLFETTNTGGDPLVRFRDLNEIQNGQSAAPPAPPGGGNGEGGGTDEGGGNGEGGGHGGGGNGEGGGGPYRRDHQQGLQGQASVRSAARLSKSFWWRTGLGFEPVSDSAMRQAQIAYSLLVAVVLFAIGALHYANPPVLQRVRAIAFDAYQQFFPRTYDPALPVRIVDIDEASLAALGQWPWPRTDLAQLIERLETLGAVAIVFDMVFPGTRPAVARRNIQAPCPASPEVIWRSMRWRGSPLRMSGSPTSSAGPAS